MTYDVSESPDGDDDRPHAPNGDPQDEPEPNGLTFKTGEHLGDCAMCGSALESRGDCSNAACWSHANIAHEILLSAKARKTLSTTCTGGGFDYISRVLWDNGPEMILHAQGEEPAGSDFRPRAIFFVVRAFLSLGH